MSELNLWQVFASLGVPGLALGVFYFLFQKFNFKLPQAPKIWVGPIIETKLGQALFVSNERTPPYSLYNLAPPKADSTIEHPSR